MSLCVLSITDFFLPVASCHMLINTDHAGPQPPLPLTCHCYRLTTEPSHSLQSPRRTAQFDARRWEARRHVPGETSPHTTLRAHDGPGHPRVANAPWHTDIALSGRVV